MHVAPNEVPDEPDIEVEPDKTPVDLEIQDSQQTQSTEV